MQKWLELLQSRVHASKLEEPTEKKTEIVHKEEEEEEEEEKEEAVREEVGLSAEAWLWGRRRT